MSSKIIKSADDFVKQKLPIGSLFMVHSS